MPYKTRILPGLLHFGQPAGTSRGVYTTRKIWYVWISSTDMPGRWGVGECAPLPALSRDDLPDYEGILAEACLSLQRDGFLNKESLRPYPSILFGLETAIRHLHAGSMALWDTPFSRGEAGIPINGLIWMGDYKKMLEQIEHKMKTGFRCIKLKIGAIRFDEELALLKHIRLHFTANDIELRVDANGAFSPIDALDKLNRLAELDLHSIEQPIGAGKWEQMALLAEQSPLPIALDEELIGHDLLHQKEALLDTIRPQYIVLKPSLHGGISGCEEWIRLSQKIIGGNPNDPKWWITSALESNIGLNAIAQWTATLNNPLPQGLGTGQLFTDNVPMPLSIRKDSLWFDPNGPFHSTELSYQQGHHASAFKELHNFKQEWFNESPTITVHTSGSTGTPKELIVRKEQMRQSARLTCQVLGLSAGDKALLCMPLRYIAGKMMVVRALEANLDLIAHNASGHPLADLDIPDLRFAAMIPLQVYNTLLVAEEKKRLERIGTLIIGGGAIDEALEKEIRLLPNPVYSTYGMTETLSHIALRRLNGSEASAYYHPFPSVCLSISDEGTLVIDAPLVCDDRLVTNDMVHLLPDGSFCVIGRKDNIINSGGVKIQIEEVEKALRPCMSAPFAITSVSDPKFGEVVVLLTELVPPSDFNALPPYWRPRYTFKVDHIPLTGSGKINRAECLVLAQSKITEPFVPNIPR